jgi:hypothetical protein
LESGFTRNLKEADPGVRLKPTAAYARMSSDQVRG